VNEHRLEEAVFELVSYMVTSGRNLIDETPLYGPFRLVDAASRLVSILKDEGIASHRLSQLQEAIDNQKYSVMQDEQTFQSFLDSLVDLVVDNASFETGGDEKEEH
jgi:hypothetical protein